ncbi:RrF2 family transcriptional regulator [Piscinibacter sakaiensis]|uniref:RrF2 family transcriptional regulator n=1 Tax=Piscinibacter sakaiensis TaxID=1547922 RepID=UPI003AAB340E
MRLAEYTDFTLRVLMYCAANRNRLVTVAELAEQLCLSKNHLMKIVNDLARQDVIETLRGRGGGLRLLQDPQQIRIGDVVRRCETDFRLVECFDQQTDACTLTPGCRLKGVFGAALRAFFEQLDAATLADIAVPTALPHSEAKAWPLGGGKLRIAAPADKA